MNLKYFESPARKTKQAWAFKHSRHASRVIGWRRAKREETREKRFPVLAARSEQGLRIPHLTPRKPQA